MRALGGLRKFNPGSGSVRIAHIADIPRGRGEQVKLTLSGHLPVNNAAAKWRVPSGQALGAERTRQWTAKMS